MAHPHRTPVLRLAQLIRDGATREGSYAELSRRIHQLNVTHLGEHGPPGKLTVDRRKLAAIAGDATNVVISFDELLALETYLERQGASLARHPLFQKPEVHRTLAESKRIAFLLGAHFDEAARQTSVADYDVLAMTEIQSRVCQHSTPVLDFRDTLLKDTREAAIEATKETCIELFAEEGPSIVAVGSPRGSHASEIMLGRMFGLSEAEMFHDDPGSRLPFHFIWPHVSGERVVESVTHLKHEVLPALEGSEREFDCVFPSGTMERRIPPDTRAFDHPDLTDPILAEPPNWDGSRDVGVLCCQRRPGGQIWICVAGLSGAATLAAAMALDRVDADIPPLRLRGGLPSDVLWATVVAGLKRDKDMTCQAIRRVLSFRIEGPLHLTTPRDPNPQR
jgi:hypothetical protein